MKKSLHDLTKEDWNSLFPVALADHNPQWKWVFEQEKKRIVAQLGTATILRVEHFGSTSIPGIKAKPYIDLLIEIPADQLFDENLIAQFSALEYSHFVVPKRENIDAYSSFGKGYRLDGVTEQIFHIHMCPKDNVMWQQLEFRDYLIANKTRAKAYEDLKLQLAATYKNDRGAYVLGKTAFVKETLALIAKEKNKP